MVYPEGFGRTRNDMCWHGHRLARSFKVGNAIFAPCANRAFYGYDFNANSELKSDELTYLFRRRACAEHKLPGDKRIGPKK